MSGPFNGVRVLELTSTVSGPFAGMMLADQGAEVIKIEPPGIGDLARFMGTIKDGMGAMFSPLNRNKICICLDFKIEDGIFDLLDDLDKVVLEYDGRIYLSKDSRVSKSVFESGYPRISRFRQLRKNLNLGHY